MKHKIFIILPFLLLIGCSKPIKNIIVFGDSLSANMRWVQEITNNVKIHIDNEGLSGSTTKDMMNIMGIENNPSFASNVLKKYDAVIIWCGINDIAKCRNVNELERNIIKIDDFISGMGKRIYWISIPNCINYRYYDGIWFNTILWMNAYLGVQNQYNKYVKFINCDDKIWKESSIYTYDGLHLNDNGGKIVGQNILSFIWGNSKVK